MAQKRCMLKLPNVAGLPWPVREYSSDESLEKLENPSEDESPELSFHFNRSPVHSSSNCTRPPLLNLILCILMSGLSMSW